VALTWLEVSCDSQSTYYWPWSHVWRIGLLFLNVKRFTHSITEDYHNLKVWLIDLSTRRFVSNESRSITD